MKQTRTMKLILLAFLVLAASYAYADLLPIYNPALHRIGYEVFVYVAGAVMGSALVRYLAKKDWRIGERWKDYSDMKEADAVEIERKIREVRPLLTVAVRAVYDKVDGLLEGGWKHDMVLAALETDDDLMSRCKGIPIECLMNEAEKAVKEELDARLANVLPDFKRTFDTAYEIASVEWLQADAAALRKINNMWHSFWGKIRYRLSSEYRRKTEIAFREWGGSPRIEYMWRRTCAWRWSGLCISLVDSILESYDDLKLRCRGVDKNALIRSVNKKCPQNYDGAYYTKGYEIEDEGNLSEEVESLTIIHKDVDIEKAMKHIREESAKLDFSDEKRREAYQKWLDNEAHGVSRMEDLQGKGLRIGGFRILAEIMGTSSQDQVFKAVCEKAPFDGIEPGTVVALKRIPVHDEYKCGWAKLKKRTDELVRLYHPNVVKYYGCFFESGPFNDVHVIVQEFLEGETLKQRLVRNPSGLDADEAIRVTDAALSGLEYTAANGILHRDVSPDNIFLCLDGGVKIIGFEDVHQEGDSTTSALGNLVRPSDYMAPELSNSTFCGDERSDMFSMGVVMHETITGRTPYRRSEGESDRADLVFLSRWAKLHVDGTNPIRIGSRANRLLANSSEVLEKALAPLPENRYESFAAFRAGLNTIRYRFLRNGHKVYHLLQFIGEGGFGEVFKARLMESGQIVAIKHMLKDSYAERFYLEAKIRTRLDDPCFVHFVDFFKMDHAGRREAFLVMDFLPGMPGSSLRDAIKRAGGSPLPFRETLLAFARFAHGLSALHSNGIIHHAIKPAKLYYPEGWPERAIVMDFAWPRDVDITVCQTLAHCGLDYVAPEMALGSSRHHVGCDIYALGLSLYEALTGKIAYPPLPQGSAAVAAFYERVRSQTLPTFDSPVVSSCPKLLQLLKDMTNIDPEKRIRDAAEVERRLSELTATVNEQASSGAHCLDDAPASAKNDNATKTEERNPDEIPTDDGNA